MLLLFNVEIIISAWMLSWAVNILIASCFSQQGADAVRHAAQQGSDAKESDAPHKQATAAIVIAKLTAHRQADGKGDAVERDDKLQLRSAGRQGVGDGVQRHIGDRGINKRQHLAAQQQQQTGAAG